MKKSQAVSNLISYFGNQKETGSILGVKQATVSGWLNMKHTMRETKALKAEKLTKGEIKAVDLCPALAELEETP